MKHNYPVIQVEWQDAQRACDDWTLIEEIDMDISLCTSVGYLIREDDFVILILPHLDSLDASGHAIGGMKIPKCAVVNRRILK